MVRHCNSDFYFVSIFDITCPSWVNCIPTGINLSFHMTNSAIGDIGADNPCISNYNLKYNLITIIRSALTVKYVNTLEYHPEKLNEKEFGNSVS